MPFALPGALTVLLTQAAPLCGPATTPPDPARTQAAVVQRDDAFVIVSAKAAEPMAVPVYEPVRPAGLRLGRAVQIDPALLLAKASLLRRVAR